MTVPIDPYVWIASEITPNGRIVEHVWPRAKGYAWCAVLLNRRGRLINWRNGEAPSRPAAEDLAEGAGAWLGNHPLAFKLRPVP